jgi:hypothetical protein
MVGDMHQKISSWLAGHYRRFLLLFPEEGDGGAL